MRCCFFFLCYLSEPDTICYLRQRVRCNSSQLAPDLTFHLEAGKDNQPGAITRRACQTETSTYGVKCKPTLRSQDHKIAYSSGAIAALAQAALHKAMHIKHAKPLDRSTCNEDSVAWVTVKSPESYHAKKQLWRRKVAIERILTLLIR
jgi:hypothetical protein